MSEIEAEVPITNSQNTASESRLNNEEVEAVTVGWSDLITRDASVAWPLPLGIGNLSLEVTRVMEASRPLLQQTRQFEILRRQMEPFETLRRQMVETEGFTKLQQLTSAPSYLKAFSSGHDRDGSQGNIVRQGMYGFSPVLGSLVGASLSLPSESAAFANSISSFAIKPSPLWNSLGWLNQNDAFSSRMREQAAAASRMRKMREETEKGSEALRYFEYFFLVSFLDFSFVAELRRLQEEARYGEVYEAMRFLSCHPSFRVRLKATLNAHPSLAWRWEAVSQGLFNHRKGNFHASVRTLLPEAEGILTDIMMARGELKLQNKSYYALDANGNVLQEMNKYGTLTKVKMSGLSMKAQHCKPPDASVLRWVNNHFLQQLSQPRNKTLHGQDASMGNAQFSTRLVWAIYALSFGAAEELFVQETMRTRTSSDRDARDKAGQRLDGARIYLGNAIFQQ